MQLETACSFSSSPVLRKLSIYTYVSLLFSLSVIWLNAISLHCHITSEFKLKTLFAFFKLVLMVFISFFVSDQLEHMYLYRIYLFSDLYLSTQSFWKAFSHQCNIIIHFLWGTIKIDSLTVCLSVRRSSENDFYKICGNYEILRTKLQWFCVLSLMPLA